MLHNVSLPFSGQTLSAFSLLVFFLFAIVFCRVFCCCRRLVSLAAFSMTESDVNITVLHFNSS